MMAATVTAFHRGMTTVNSVQTLVMWLLIGAAVTTAVVACLLGLPLLHRVQQASDGVIAPFVRLPAVVKATMTQRAGRQFQSLRRLLRQADDIEAGDTSSGDDAGEEEGAPAAAGASDDSNQGRSTGMPSSFLSRSDVAGSGLQQVPSFLTTHSTRQMPRGGSWLRTTTARVVPVGLEGATAASSSRSDDTDDSTPDSGGASSTCGGQRKRCAKAGSACAGAVRGRVPLMKSWLRFTGPAWLVLGAVIVVYAVTVQEVASLKELLVVAMTASARTTCAKEAWVNLRKLQATVAPTAYRHALFWMTEDLLRW